MYNEAVSFERITCSYRRLSSCESTRCPSKCNVDGSEELKSCQYVQRDHKSCKRVQGACKRDQDGCKRDTCNYAQIDERSQGEEQLIFIQIFYRSVQNFSDSYIQNNISLLNQPMNYNHQINCYYLNTNQDEIQYKYENLERCYIILTCILVIIEHISYSGKKTTPVKFNNDMKNILLRSEELRVFVSLFVWSRLSAAVN